MSRRETLINFFNEMSKRIDNDKDKVLFIQCFDALNEKEGHGFNFYKEEVNWLIRAKEAGHI